MTSPSFIRPLAALSLAALGLGAGTGCAGRAASAGPPPATPVTLATAAAPAARALYAGPGEVAPARVYRVGFELPGRVVTVHADVGDRVAAGALLAELDGSDYAAQERGATARAAQALAGAAKTRNGARAQERRAADEAVAAARAQLARAQTAQGLAEAGRARFDLLYASGDIPAQQHDQTVAAARDAAGALAAARAQLAGAEAQRALVRDGARAEDVAASAAAARAAAADAELARVTLGKTRIVAPAEAYVEQRAVEPGSSAQPGASAFVLVDAREPDVLVAVPETRLDGIAPGTAAVVRSAGRTYRAAVARVEPDADPATRTAQVRLRVPGLRARRGGVVEVALGARPAGGTASVPLAAVVSAPGGATSVLVYDPARKRALRRAVRVVGADGERALVSGLAPGTQVVRAGAALVQPGAPLAVVAP
jgi:multidrug resistance efflux pump